jgi:adenine-specific DNA-methyltransferase
MLSTYTQIHAESIGRVYGGGVLKFELKDARRLPLLMPSEPIEAAIFNRIDTALKSGASEVARELADEAILPTFCGASWRDRREQLSARLVSARALRGVSANPRRIDHG